MNPGISQTLCQIACAFGIIVTGLAGFGSYYYGKKANEIENKKQQENQQITTSKLDELLEFVGSDNRTKLLEKYPAGYVLFGFDLSSTFSTANFPREGKLLDEYEFDWSNVKIEHITSNSLTILMPNICYKPLNSSLIGSSLTIPRKPYGKAFKHPLKPKGTQHRIFVELLKDNNQQLIFVIGFRKEE